MASTRHILATLCPIALVLGIASCKREDRGFRVDPPAARPATSIVVSGGFNAGAFPMPAAYENDYEKNAYALSEGKRLFEYFNCSGCHFHGGGGIGPPLMDDRWIYGSDPGQVFATGIQGRPNGIPSYATKL